MQFLENSAGTQGDLKQHHSWKEICSDWMKSIFFLFSSLHSEPTQLENVTAKIE